MIKLFQASGLQEDKKTGYELTFFVVKILWFYNMNLHVIFTFQIHVITQKIKLLSWNFM